jgi:hypothetical protein
MGILITALVVSAVVGFAVNRFWTILVPAVAWPAFFVGLDREWWGYGLGEGWWYGLALGMISGIAAAAVGLTARRLLAETGHRRRGRRRELR